MGRLDPFRNEGKTPMNNAEVSPWLATLPNGVVTMVYDRPGLHITFSVLVQVGSVMLPEKVP